MQIGRPGGSTPACSAPNTSRVQRKQTEGDTCVVLHSQGFLQRENLLSSRYLKRCAKSSNLAQKQSSYCIIKHLLYQHATGPSPFGLISHSWGFQSTKRSLGAPSQQPRAPCPAGPFSAILCRRAALRGGGRGLLGKGAGPARLPPAARLSLPRAAAAPGRHWPGGPTWGARGRGRLPGERQGEERRRRQRRSPAEPCGAGAEPERSRAAPAPRCPAPGTGTAVQLGPGSRGAPGGEGAAGAPRAVCGEPP